MGQKNLSHDANFDLLLTYVDATLKLSQVDCVNRYADQVVTVRIDPTDPTTGVEDVTREISRTFAPGETFTQAVPTSGGKSIQLVFNSRGSLVGYNTYIGVSPA